MNSGNVYFISDAHLGSWAFDDALERERHLVRFLDSIKDKASAIYMMGDMFDFWYEFKYVVPKGYTRFLGKLSELTDSGIEVHFFTGNHDMWMFGYLEKECGVILHGEPECCSIMGHRFYLAHGDGLGDPGLFFRITRPVFRNRFCQFLFSLLPTRWSMYLGQAWARHSMLEHRKDGKNPQYMGEDNEFQIQFAKQYLKTDPGVEYFMFGHRHIELDLMLTRNSRAMILGDFMQLGTYACFDGNSMVMENFE